ncbi:shikimate dehydrogenase family protein [Polaromonas aquatica]|uniref:shikimate dehydrogenase family protein n=1 Tax=Polaromonas aquatica TaxID=332657 RepID=UPI003D64A3B1
MINGHTGLIAHIGYPTHSFKAPMIYNPYFEQAAVNAVVVPMGCKAEDYPVFLRSVTRLENFRGALITMPHKVTTVDLLDEATPTVRIAGACNAVKRDANGKLVGDMFDGEGFVRGVQRKGFDPRGKRALVIGSGGVGSAIAASLAKAGVRTLGLCDVNAASAQALAGRLHQHYAALELFTGLNDPAGYDLVVNATPMGMNEGDPLPMDVSRIAASSFVGEVVMKSETTAFLAAAMARGCTVQIGSDMLFEQIPAYLEFFGLPTTTPDVLRSVAQLSY